jgi:hypothetical protein
VGGFATRAEAVRALQRTLERLRPGAAMTLAELVDEYLIPDRAPGGALDDGEAALAAREGDGKVKAAETSRVRHCDELRQTRQ